MENQPSTPSQKVHQEISATGFRSRVKAFYPMLDMAERPAKWAQLEQGWNKILNRSQDKDLFSVLYRYVPFKSQIIGVTVPAQAM